MSYLTWYSGAHNPLISQTSQPKQRLLLLNGILVPLVFITLLLFIIFIIGWIEQPVNCNFEEIMIKEEKWKFDRIITGHETFD